MPNFNGTAGDDIFTGGSDADTAVGNGGNDALSGGGNNDLLVGNAGADILNGGEGDDRLFSGDESPPYSLPYYGNPYTPPLLDTGSESDTLNGGAGDDIIFAGYGDNVDGGTGSSYGDKLFISFMGASSGVIVDFRLSSQVIGGGTITGIENVSWVQGSNFDDDINVATATGNSYSDFTAVFGMGGNDRLVAGYYTGTLFGGDGNDIVDGRGSQYLQSVDGGAGDDTLYTNSNTFATALGGDGNDTIYSHGTTYGGSGNDLIILSFSYYGGVAYGEQGNDEIRAASSGTTMSGGEGADILTGDAGSDKIYSAGLLNGLTPLDDMGREHDVLTGFGGNDLLAAGFGDDVDGGSGTDTLRLSFGGALNSVVFDTAGIVAGTPFTFAGGTINSIETLAYLRGSDFLDTLTLATQAELLTVDAGDGDDIVTSSNSSVTLAGGNGNDRFISGAAGDTFDGGAGTDTIDYRNAAAGVTVALGLAAGQTGTGAGGDTLTNVENIDGSGFGDTLSGSDGANFIRGMGGSDTLDGKGGNDTLDGGIGADMMTGGLGDDLFFVDDAGDQVFEAASQGSDEVRTALASLTLAQNVEKLTGTGNVNQSLTGNAGANVIDGGAGADSMAGAGGDDSYIVDNAGDVATEGENQGLDTVYAFISYALSEGSHVEVLSAIDWSSTAALSFAGNGFANIVYGNAGANVLDGRGGADIMSGFGGDDIYFADNAGDVVIEGQGQGIDTLYAFASYVMTEGSHVETLSTIDWSSTAQLNLTGNALANRIYGNAGANMLNGGAGADVLIGFGGDDVYFVDSAADIVSEALGQGYDTVYASADHGLSEGSHVEILSAANWASTAGLNLTGNSLSNVLFGNAGANMLNGGGGADLLYGFGGDDTYFVDHAGDVAIETAGQGYDTVYAFADHALAEGSHVEILSTEDWAAAVALNLTGNGLANTLFGNAGANVLNGGGGADALTGFGGADAFAFTTALGGGNVDTVGDFVHGTDKIALDDAIFTAITGGSLSAGAFVIGTGAGDSDDRIIYNSATGALLYDADGNGGGAAVQFATLGTGLALTASDFQMI